MIDQRAWISFERLVQRHDPTAILTRAYRLSGGVSALITALEIERADGTPIQFVVREHGETDRARNLQIARDEFRLMQIARARGLSVPEPYYLDESCDLFPVPVLVTELIDGTATFAPADIDRYLDRSAAELAKIHAVAASPELAFLPRLDSAPGPPLAQLDEELGEKRIRDALMTNRSGARQNPDCLLHGDYWPGNLLWQDGQLVSVVDWEDAALGDPLADLSNSRLELLWAFGVEAMDIFTSRYLSLAAIDSAALPYWDLLAALRPCSKLSTWDLDAATERQMRERHRWFVDQALERLSSSGEKGRSHIGT
jgi:aminoglycoside phosphotransferase (APT) family kinase protein